MRVRIMSKFVLGTKMLLRKKELASYNDREIENDLVVTIEQLHL